ncbi:MAG: lipid-A-disaccharide synthase [Thiotrichales bacterium]|nr:lipid-A-disaccharide synthase [Thiotrichales bacterium]
MRFAIVAGEPSGDMLASGLVEAIRARVPEARFEGIAGPRMLALGCQSLYPMERLSVMGLTEAAGRYLELVPVRRRLARRFAENPPDAFIGVDAPDFNLSLELALRRAGVRTVHFVSPSVWAWRRYRLAKIARAVDMMLALLPFEPQLYEERSIPVRFVGHPLADEIAMRTSRDAARERLGLDRQARIVALLPGSRMSELRRLAEPLARTARWVQRRRPDVRFVVPLVDRATHGFFARALDEHAPDARCDLFLGQSRDAMAASDVILLASGTASLEAMLIKRPMVITYRTMRLTWMVGRAMLHVDHVGLPNLLAGRRLVPELLQDEATPERLGALVLDRLDHPERQRAVLEEFDRIHHMLRNDAFTKASEAVLEVAAA